MLMEIIIYSVVQYVNCNYNLSNIIIYSAFMEQKISQRKNFFTFLWEIIYS